MKSFIIALGLAFTSFSATNIETVVKSTRIESPITDFSFTNLQNNERLEINLSSSGCFHKEKGKIIVTSGLASLGEKVRILSAEDLASLDGYIKTVNLLREEDGWCTTKTRYAMTLYRNDKAVEFKELIDFACVGFDSEMTLYGLYYTLTEDTDTTDFFSDADLEN